MLRNTLIAPRRRLMLVLLVTLAAGFPAARLSADDLPSDIVLLSVLAEDDCGLTWEQGSYDIYDLLQAAIPPEDGAVRQISFERVGRAASAQPALFQGPSSGPAPQAQPEGAGSPFADDPITSLQLDLANNPCAAMAEKPLRQLGIAIAAPAGKLPDNHAGACWDRLNAAAGTRPGARYWSASQFSWNATCLCHRPLYFEEINLERHGYGCGDCLQPLVSGAHFFATVPVLPYCMAVDCPGECVYTLGHYRPGSCPPWRHHWPPCDPLAAGTQAGFVAGLILLFP